MNRWNLSADQDFAPAFRPYKATFLPLNLTIDVSPARSSPQPIGRPGGLLDAALALAPAAEIEHVCGGHAACTTCRVEVIEGLAGCNPRGAQEEAALAAEGKDLSPASRLACQLVPTGTMDLIVRIPPRRT